MSATTAQRATVAALRKLAHEAGGRFHPIQPVVVGDDGELLYAADLPLSRTVVAISRAGQSRRVGG